MTTWFITGAARGLGLAIARHALRAGANVVATARDPGRVEAAFATSANPSTGTSAGGSTNTSVGTSAHPDGRLLPLGLDVTDAGQAARAVEASVARFGAVDVLVNNAGRGLLGAVEEASAAEIEAVFATNVFGLLTVTRAVLPQLRARRHGRIVNITSMGGFAQVAGWGIYGATKFAVEGLSESLQAELSPLGITVTIVEPGSFRTGFLEADSLHTTATQIPDYADTAGRVRTAAPERSGRQLNDPAKGAAAIYAAVTADAPPARLQLGPDAIALVEAKLTRVREELERWRELGASTLCDPAVDPTGT